MWTYVSDIPLLCALLVLTLVLGFQYLKRRRSCTNLPPGPWGLPGIGYLHLLWSSDIKEDVDRLRRKYGDVFGMYMGNKYALFLGSAELCREAFNMDQFTGRPDGFIVISKEFENFAATSGQKWKDHRRVAVKALRYLGTAKDTIHHSAKSHIGIALDRLEREVSRSPNGLVNIRHPISMATSGVICELICGKTYPEGHEVQKIFQRYLKFFAQIATPLSLDIFVPVLSPIIFLTMPNRRGTLQSFKDLENFFWSEIGSHEQNPAEEPRDFLDCYLQERRKTSPERFSRGDMNGDSLVMVFAGSDTVRSTVEWFLLCMAENVPVQEKVYQEINQELGTSGEFRYEDHVKLPYTEATILECMRFKTVTPFSVVHSATEETTFKGFRIPKNAVIISCQWSIHNDPKKWKNPGNFDPENFLDSEGRTLDIPESFMPFGTGKRICMGDKLAMIEIFLFVVPIVQRFKILPPDGGVKMDENIRVTSEAKYPFVRLEKRQTSYN